MARGHCGQRRCLAQEASQAWVGRCVEGVPPCSRRHGLCPQGGCGVLPDQGSRAGPPHPSMLQGTGDPAADAGGCWPEWAELGVLPSAPRPPGTGRLVLGTPPTRSVLRCRAQVLSLRKLVKGAVQEKR